MEYIVKRHVQFYSKNFETVTYFDSLRIILRQETSIYKRCITLRQ